MATEPGLIQILGTWAVLFYCFLLVFMPFLLYFLYFLIFSVKKIAYSVNSVFFPNSVFVFLFFRIAENWGFYHNPNPNP